MATTAMNVGLVGLGLMGAALATRLLARGHRVIGFDVIAAKTEAAAGTGVEPAASAAAVAAAADVVLISVTGMPALEAALFAADGILAEARRGQVIVDLSTSDGPTTTVWAGQINAEHGVDWIDAPVSGGPPAAMAGTLAIMAGGEAAVLDRVRPLLDDLGKVTHMGPLGAGQATKMVNQVLVLTNYCVLAEALKLAENAGVDAARIPEALADGHAGSNMLAHIFPRMLARAYEPPAGLAAQILKDLDMVHDTARSTATPTPMTDTARSLFRLFCSRGHGGEDGIALLKLYDQGEV